MKKKGYFKGCFIYLIEFVLIQRKCNEGLNDSEMAVIFCDKDLIVSLAFRGDKQQQKTIRITTKNICIGPEFHNDCIPTAEGNGLRA